MNDVPQTPGRRQGLLKLGCLVSVLASSCIPISAQAAETIQLTYGPLEATVYVEDLTVLAENGEVSDRLRKTTRRFSDDQLSSLQSFLNFRFDVSPVMMSQFAYSPIGEPLIQRIGQVVQTENHLNGFSAIRAGFILATTEEEGLTAINFLNTFPLDSLKVDLPLALQILTENRQIYQQRDDVVAQLRQLSKTQFPEPFSPPDLQLDQPGPQPWRVETFRFQNPNRTDRSIISRADAYLPDRPSSLPQKSVPIIVISHGTASNRETLAYLARHWASHGYAVLIPEHPETTTAKFARFFSGFEGAPNAAGLLYRPQDITAVLDTLEQQAQQDPTLSSLDFSTVGVLGQSLGGYTALAAAGAQLNNQTELEQVCPQSLEARPQLNLSILLQCRLLELPAEQLPAVEDRRVKAAIAVNPLSKYVFGQSGLSTLDKPTLIVSGLEDYFTPAIPEQIQPFAWIGSSSKHLLVMEKGTHFSFLSHNNDSVFPIPQALLGDSPEKPQALLQTISLAFFEYHIKGEAKALNYLNQSYINSVDLGLFQSTLVQGNQE